MKRFLLILLLIAFAAVGYFAYTVFSKRENDLTGSSDSPAKEQQTADTSTNTPTTPQKNIIENLFDSEPSDGNTQEENTDQTKTSDDDYYVHVTPTDCARECEPYKYDEKELAYCQNVCGISEGSSANDCDKLKDLAKDYCYKDQAIDKKDASICDKISDTAIKRTCKNRIQEDVLENM